MPGESCTFLLSPLGVSGDDLYTEPLVGNQALIDALFWGYGFGGHDDAWLNSGIKQADDPESSLGRALAAVYLLTHSAPGPLTEESSQIPVFWGPIQVHNHIDDLRPGCGPTFATSMGPEWVRLNPLFFEQSVAERAGTLVHESRHQSGKHVNSAAVGHDATFAPSSSYYKEEDPNKLGADSSWEYWGAWALHASYLSSFFWQGTGTTSALRERARQKANVILDNTFTVHPGFTVAPLLLSPCSVVSREPNIMDVFVRGFDGAVYQKAWTQPGPWAPGPGPADWWEIGGGIIGTPVTVSWAPDRLDLFVLGTDYAIYHKGWADGTWYPGEGKDEWIPLGGVCLSQPVVVSWGSDQLHLFVTGADNAVYQKIWHGGPTWLPGNGLEDWVCLGGGIVGAPAVTSWGPDRLDIVVMGTKGEVYHKAWDTDTWYPSPDTDKWEPLGGHVVAPPAAISWGPNRLDIFGIGLDNAVYHKWWDGSKWRPEPIIPDNLDPWERLGGPFGAGVANTPSVVSWGPGRLDVFVVGTDACVYHKALVGTTWYPAGEDNWEWLGGQVAGPPAVVSRTPNRIDIFGPGTDAQLRHKWWDGSKWGPNPYDQTEWELIGGKLG